MAVVHENTAAAEAVAPLVFPFTRGEYRHVLLSRAGRVCLVERTSTRRHSRGSVHYEVIVVQVIGPTTWPDGRVAPTRESYPGSTLWGSAGWTCTTHAAAERRFREVVGALDRTVPYMSRTCADPASPSTPAPREAARSDGGSENGHSRRHPDPVARPPREVAPATEVFAQRPMLAGRSEVAGA